MVLTKNRCYSIFIFFLVNLSIFYPQKLLANVNNPEQKQNNRISTQIDVRNQEQTPFDSWLKIIQQNKDQLSQHELALIKSKVASAFFQVGNYQEAIEYWRWANKVYRTNQQNRLLANNLSNLARAYLSLGETLLAEKKINEVMKIAQEEQLKDVLFSGYLTLGNIAKLTGKYLEAETNFNKSFEYARRIEEKIAVNLNLSQVFNAQAERLLKRTQAISAEDLELESTEQQIISYQHKAWAAANRAVKPSENLESLIAVDALLQAIQLAHEYEVDDFNPAPLLNKVGTILSALPHSSRKVYALINLSTFEQNPLAILRQAEKIAEQIQALRAQSYALGNIGQYYEQAKQYQKALEATEKAIFVASETEDYKSLYRWQWQKGRIYTALNASEKAITAYNQAIAYLRSIKAEVAKSTEQLDFSTEIEPVYRELLQLLLAGPTPAQIEQALRIRDLLQLSELENFFGDDCLELISGQENLLPSQTGVIYSIVLPEVTYLIFKQGKVTTSKKINISQSELEKSIGQWRYSLEDRSEANYWSLSQQMYALLLEPIKSELSSLQPDTLIFVNDGLLRNVPMAALHDGQNFLIQDYALSFSLSLNLRVREEKTSIHNTQILAFALSEETDIFSALPYVQEEIDSINELVKVQRFFNTEFVISKVEKELVENDYGIVHFATHAKFNGTLEDSFLKTYQEQISLTDLENMLNLHQLNFPEKPLELLTLSACETAASNKSATLGMAGVAIRSGVRNAVGSLWSISDRGSVNIITEFYRGLLSQELPPNEALRQAQIKMISDNPYFHPAVWSNLILIDS